MKKVIMICILTLFVLFSFEIFSYGMEISWSRDGEEWKELSDENCLCYSDKTVYVKFFDKSMTKMQVNKSKQEKFWELGSGEKTEFVETPNGERIITINILNIEDANGKVKTCKLKGTYIVENNMEIQSVLNIDKTFYIYRGDRPNGVVGNNYTKNPSDDKIKISINEKKILGIYPIQSSGLSYAVKAEWECNSDCILGVELETGLFEITGKKAGTANVVATIDGEKHKFNIEVTSDETKEKAIELSLKDGSKEKDVYVAEGDYKIYKIKSTIDGEEVDGYLTDSFSETKNGCKVSKAARSNEIVITGVNAGGSYDYEYKSYDDNSSIIFHIRCTEKGDVLSKHGDDEEEKVYIDDSEATYGGSGGKTVKSSSIGEETPYSEDVDDLLTSVENDEFDFDKEIGPEATEIINTVLGYIIFIGIVFSVVGIAILGFRYILGSAQQKTEYKETLVTFAIGAFMVVCGTTLVKFILDIALNW